MHCGWPPTSRRRSPSSRKTSKGCLIAKSCQQASSTSKHVPLDNKSVSTAHLLCPPTNNSPPPLNAFPPCRLAFRSTRLSSHLTRMRCGGTWRVFLSRCGGRRRVYSLRSRARGSGRRRNWLAVSVRNSRCTTTTTTRRRRATAPSPSTSHFDIIHFHANPKKSLLLVSLP